MIDIHSHILYGVDDGCETIDDSIDMIKESIKAGVTDLVLTPHFSYGRLFIKSYKDVESKFRTLKIEVLKNNLNINLYLGSEIDENKNMLNILKDDMCHSLNYTKYVLVDFMTRVADVDEVCYELVLNGYIPIIAHPERYAYVKDISMMKEWKKTGALIQMNASSLYSCSKVKKQAKLMLKHNVVDIVSSDTHTSSKTFDYFKKSLNYIKKKYGEEAAKRMFNINPRKIIGLDN